METRCQCGRSVGECCAGLDVIGGRRRQHQDTIVGYTSSKQRSKRGRIGNVLDYLRRVNDIEATPPPAQHNSAAAHHKLARRACGASLPCRRLNTNRVASDHLRRNQSRTKAIDVQKRPPTCVIRDHGPDRLPNAPPTSVETPEIVLILANH